MTQATMSILGNKEVIAVNQGAPLLLYNYPVSIPLIIILFFSDPLGVQAKKARMMGSAEASIIVLEFIIFLKKN